MKINEEFNQVGKEFDPWLERYVECSPLKKKPSKYKKAGIWLLKATIVIGLAMYFLPLIILVFALFTKPSQ